MGCLDALAVRHPEPLHDALGHEHEPAHRVDDHGKRADTDAAARQQQRRQHERASVPEQHQDPEPEIDEPNPEVLTPARRVEAAQHRSIPPQQPGSRAQDPRLLEVLPIVQAALQIFELPLQRNRPALEPVVPAATDEVTGDAGHEDEGNDQRQRWGERMEVDSSRRNQRQHGDRVQERHQHPKRSLRPRLRQLQALVRIQGLEVDDFEPRGCPTEGLGQHADALGAEVRGKGTMYRLDELPRQDHQTDKNDRAGDLVPPLVGQC